VFARTGPSSVRADTRLSTPRRFQLLSCVSSPSRWRRDLREDHSAPHSTRTQDGASHGHSAGLVDGGAHSRARSESLRPAFDSRVSRAAGRTRAQARAPPLCASFGAATGRLRGAPHRDCGLSIASDRFLEAEGAVLRGGWWDRETSVESRGSETTMVIANRVMWRESFPRFFFFRPDTRRRGRETSRRRSPGRDRGTRVGMRAQINRSGTTTRGAAPACRSGLRQQSTANRMKFQRADV